MLVTEALLRISKEVGAPLARVETTITLLEGGATVPFIARYRKEATGNLDEVRIRDIDERRAYYGALEARSETTPTAEQPATPAIEAQLVEAQPAEAAPASEEQAAPPPAALPEPKRESPKRVNNVEEAVEGALHILAERIAENPEFRKR